MCCPLIKECVSVGAACSPDGPIKPKETNCTAALEAECEGDKPAPWNKNLTCAECVKVVVRIRPLNRKEKQDGHTEAAIVDEKNGTITVSNPKGDEGDPPKNFSFDSLPYDSSTRYACR